MTAPVEVIVLVVPNRVEPTMPNRTSLPSRAAPAAWVADPPPASSNAVMAATETVKSVPITASTA